MDCFPQQMFFSGTSAQYQVIMKKIIKSSAINQVKGLCLVMLPKFCLALAFPVTLDLPIDSLYKV